MHLLQRYALSCGVKIGKPYISEKYFPLPVDKYITLHPNSKYQSKCYDYWQEVVDLITPYLSELGIAIVQIGAKNEGAIRNCTHIQGQTSLNQAAYVVKNSILHVGVDSFAAHFASGYSKKIVCLYSNTNIYNANPYWSKSADCVLLEPERNGKKPNYSVAENPKTINAIKPEKIASSILSLLGVSHANFHKTIYIGQSHGKNTIDIIPDMPIKLETSSEVVLNARMDLLFNEAILDKQLEIHKCNIVTDRPINLEILSKRKDNINQLLFLVDENSNPEFIKEAKRNNINVILATHKTEEEIVHKKLDFMDHGIISHIKKKTKEEVTDKTSNLIFKSKKIVFSEGKPYSCELFWRKGIEGALNDRFAPVIDEPDFWIDSDHFYIAENA